MLDKAEDMLTVDSQALVVVNGKVEYLVNQVSKMLACLLRMARLTSLFSSSSSQALDVPSGAKKGQLGQSSSTVSVWRHNVLICPFASSTALEISRGIKKADACKASVPATSADEICIFDDVAEDLKEKVLTMK